MMTQPSMDRAAPVSSSDVLDFAGSSCFLKRRVERVLCSALCVLLQPALDQAIGQGCSRRDVEVVKHLLALLSLC